MSFPATTTTTNCLIPSSPTLPNLCPPPPLYPLSPSRPTHPVDDIRCCKGSNDAPHCLNELPPDVLSGLNALHQGHVGIDALALDGVLIAHHSSLSTLGVSNQGRLNLSSANPEQGNGCVCGVWWWWR